MNFKFRYSDQEVPDASDRKLWRRSTAMISCSRCLYSMHFLEGLTISKSGTPVFFASVPVAADVEAKGLYIDEPCWSL